MERLGYLLARPTLGGLALERYTSRIEARQQNTGYEDSHVLIMQRRQSLKVYSGQLLKSGDFTQNPQRQGRECKGDFSPIELKPVTRKSFCRVKLHVQRQRASTRHIDGLSRPDALVPLAESIRFYVQQQVLIRWNQNHVI
jgi:hypothetical protein